MMAGVANQLGPQAKQVKRAETKRLLLHYAAFVFVYSFYGYQVCPYLDQLSLPQTIFPAAGAVALHWMLRTLVRNRKNNGDTPGEIGRQFRFDLGLFVLLGLATATANAFVYGFPLDSAAKVVFGFTVLGIYIAMDVALKRDLETGKALRSRGEAFPINEQFLPYQTKFLLFSGLNVVVIAIIGVMVAMKDLKWAMMASEPLGRIQLLVFMDMTFVVTVVCLYVLVVVRQYSAKIAFSLSEETKVLQAVSNGNMESRVAVVSNDEFGQVAVLTNEMIGRLQKSLDEVSRSRSAIIQALVALAARRDNETGYHLKRTQMYVELLCDWLSKTNTHQQALSETVIDDIVHAAPLHDIGKVGVPDAILRKPGRLDAAEFEIMKTHAAVGASALEEADAMLGGSPFIRTAINIASSHHERWDGKGYPNGLAGEEIPLAARIMAVADVYDALRSKRVYKPAMDHQQARAIMLEGCGSQFDPDVVSAFLAVESKIEKVADELSDDQTMVDAANEETAQAA